MEEIPAFSKTYGIKRGSIFSELTNFHCTQGLPSDVAHDMFEGVIKRMMTQLVKHCIKQKYVTLSDINERISCLKYTGVDKPEPIQTHLEVKQTFLKMGCLFRLFPFMICDKVPQEDEVWQLYLCLSTLSEYIFAPVLQPYQVEIMRELIVEYDQMKSRLLPDLLRTPKDHYLLHYADQFVLFGPLGHLWTVRFEAKHQYFCRVSKLNRCMKNICKSMAKRHQYKDAMACNQRTLINSPLPYIVNGKKVVVRKVRSSLRHALQNIVGDDEEVCIGSELKVGHTRYGKNMSAVIKMSDGCPEFVKVLNAIYVREEFVLACQELTSTYDPHFHSYLVEKTPKVSLCKVANLEDPHTLGIYRVPDTSFRGVRLRHKMIQA